MNIGKSIKRKQAGAALVEYALLLALITVVCITAVQSIGSNAQVKLNQVAEKLQADNADKQQP